MANSCETTRDGKVVVIGVNGNALDILETLALLRRDGIHIECAGFLDDSPGKRGMKFLGVEVLGGLTDAHRFEDCLFVNAIGNERNFWNKPDILAKTGLRRDQFATVIHPTAFVSPSARLAPGTVVLQNATIASNVRIGSQVMILPNSIVSHDCIVGDHTCIAGGVSISGHVTIQETCYLGTGSCLRSRITVGARSLVGMGSVVLRDIPENTVVVGNPAKYLRPTV